MKTKKHILLASAFVAFLVSSCSKDESSTTVVTPTTPSCTLNSFIEDDTAYAELTYNSDKSIKSLKVKTPSEDTTVYNFVYSPNKLVLEVDGIAFKTFFLNKNGFADSTMVDFSFLKQMIVNTFDNNGYVIRQSDKLEFFGSVVETEKKYTFSNGNLTKMVELLDRDSVTGIYRDSTIHTYTYYTDKTDNFSKFDINNYLTVNASKNLLKTETVNDILQHTYTYTFDANGNVNLATKTATSGEITKTKYNWTCK